MSESKLCMGCMEYKGNARVCPKCGYVENTPHHPAYIAPGTMLHERYMVGKLLYSNGQGATYIAYDTAVSCKVLLNEYLPEGLCVRVKGKPTVSVNYNNLAQYKALMAEYTELNKSLAKMRSLSSHLSPALDLFSENNTTYSVYEYIEGMTLVDYLKENAGELSWSEVSAMFPPLFTTLSLVHNAGVIHRAISPDTVYVTDKGELKLTDFAISGLRTVGTELNTEIYPGYAAPEQYSAASRQGTWTDVYGICAVLYRILTGSKPDSADMRIESDNLYTPQELNPNIPKQVSDVIMNGMSLDGEKRIQTVTELVTRLFDQPMSGFGKTQTLQINKDGITEMERPYENDYRSDYGSAGYYGDDYPDSYDGYDDYGDAEIIGNEQSSFDKMKGPMIIGVLIVAIVIVIVVVLVALFKGGGNESSRRDITSVSEESSVAEKTEAATEKTEETEKIVKMPSLIGKKFDDIKDSFEVKYNVTLESETAENEDYPKGVIFEQSLDMGQPITEGMTIKVKVSEGNSMRKVPEYENWALEDYIALCDKQGIKHTEVAEINPDFANGIVTKVSPGPGSDIDIETETLTIYYADTPEETTEETTEEPAESVQEEQQGGEEQQPQDNAEQPAE